MRYERKSSKCSECPLRDERRVWSTGPKSPRILILGEAPGREEANTGEPFVGPAGGVLSAGLARCGILRSGCWITNSICCRPPSNNYESDEARQAIECCAPGLRDELALAAPNVIIAAGNGACRALGIPGGITKIRGSVYEYNGGPRRASGIPVVPVYHPSYVMRIRYESVLGVQVWHADLKKAKEIAEQGWVRPQENFILEPTLEDLERVESWLGSPIAVDVETTSLDPQDSRIVVVGLAWNGESGISIPFFKRGYRPYWEQTEEPIVREFLQDVFLGHDLIFQNVLFDVRHLRADGFEIPWENIEHDTMLLHHTINPELPHRLSFIVSIYGKTPYWKEIFINRDRSIFDMEDEDLRTYNLRDCVVLHQVVPPMLEDLKDMRTEKVYYEEAIPMIRPICRMMDYGIAVDERAIKRWGKTINERLAKGEKKLRELGSLPPAFNLDSGDDLRYFLFGVRPRKFKKIEQLAEFEPDRPDGKKTRRKGTKAHEKLLVLDEISRNTRPIYRLKTFGGRRTDGGQVAVDKDGLLSYRIALQNRLADIGLFKNPKPVHIEETLDITAMLDWLEIYAGYAADAKLASTYTKFPRSSDGRIHTNYSIHGTVTRRLSSSTPNLQNIPKRDWTKEIRKIFVAGPDHMLVSGDYSNLEVWILAYETQDPKLLELLEAGLNIHDENTKLLFEIEKGNRNWELARRAAKIFQFGGLQYGGSEREIHHKIVLECPSLNLTFRQFSAAYRNWMRAHPVYCEWKDRIIREVLAKRRVYDAFGRVREFFGQENNIKKEALNFPIQAGASYVVNRATIAIDLKLEELGFESRLCLQVHDQLVAETLKEELPGTVDVIRNCMTEPLYYREKHVSFPVDIEVGPNWGELEPYE